jgi:hypothetical protein
MYFQAIINILLTLSEDQPKLEQLISSFPFNTPLIRSEEPPRPTLERHLRDITGPDHPRVVWLRWTVQQPDHKLLFNDWEQRLEWAMDEGHTSIRKIREWQEFRWELAEELRNRGFSSVLENFWPHNQELWKPSPPKIRIVK